MINPVTASTLDALVDSVIELFREDAGVHDPMRNVDWPVGNGAAFYTGMLDDPCVLLLLARDAAGPVGHLVGRLREPDEMFPNRLATLVSLRVAPRVRGQGVAGLLIGRFVQWAGQRGAAQARVSAYAGNDRARRLYERHGFAPHDVTMAMAVPARGGYAP